MPDFNPLWTAQPFRSARNAFLSVIGILAIMDGLTHPSQSLAQSATAAPKFEVASIKVCKGEGRGQQKGSDPDRGGGQNASAGRLSIKCDTLSDLIQHAYITFANGRSHPPEFQPIEGGPAWIHSDRYAIEAKAATPESQGMMNGPMLQALLEERFRLKLRRDTRQVPVYTLSVVKGGPKLQRAKDGDCAPFDFAPPLEPGQKPCGIPMTSTKGPNLTTEIEGSVADLSKLLGATLDRPVIDKTGITGAFDFRLEFAIDESTPGVRPTPSDNTPAPSIFTAIQEQLGLKLESAKGPGEFLVVDHVERPSEN
jgi:uncharacterized protein (TIGR03435 family)